MTVGFSDSNSALTTPYSCVPAGTTIAAVAVTINTSASTATIANTDVPSSRERSRSRVSREFRARYQSTAYATVESPKRMYASPCVPWNDRTPNVTASHVWTEANPDWTAIATVPRCGMTTTLPPTESATATTSASCTTGSPPSWSVNGLLSPRVTYPRSVSSTTRWVVSPPPSIS